MSDGQDSHIVTKTLKAIKLIMSSKDKQAAKGRTRSATTWYESQASAVHIDDAEESRATLNM